MLERTTQNKLAEELMEKHGFQDKDGNPLSDNSAIFYAEVCRCNAVFREFIASGERSVKEVSEAKSPVTDAIDNYNNEQLLIRLEHFEALPGKKAMEEYLSTQCVAGLKHTMDKNLGWHIKTDEPVALPAYDFIRTVCKLEYKNIVDACCIFVDNVAKNEFGDDACLSRNSMHQSYIDIRKRKGWELSDDKKKTPKELAAQLTELCNMISFGMAPNMQKMDVKYIKFSAIQGKSTANKSGKFVVKGYTTIVDAVFRALYTRKNKLAYDWDNKLYDTGTAAQTAVVANKDMAESNGNTGKDGTEAGPVTMGTPEK